MEMQFHNPPMETASRDEIESLQTQRLRETVERVYHSNPIMRDRFEKAGCAPGDIRGLENLGQIPFTTKEDLRTHYPLGLSCVDRANLREMHMSSGSTGTPIVMPYTQGDLEQWGECMARCYRMAGCRPGETVQITPSFGLFNGGFGMYHGARAAGLFVIPTGAGNTSRQIQLARDFQTRTITGVVSYGIRIMEVLAEENTSLPDLEIGIFGAEVFSEALREKINSALGIECFDIYGMTETGGVGTLGMDCPAHNGFHVWEDHYAVEVIDPRTGVEAEEGQQGELVVTSLTREALPVIRFRTGDLTHVVGKKPCVCGRTHVRIAPIDGRMDDMLIVKGVNFFPRQVEQALMEIPGVLSNYQIILEETDGVREVRVNVEAEEGVTGYQVEKKLKEALGFSPKGDVFRPGELPRQPGKAQRVFFSDTQK